jgi:endonuclease/exonuclease/phosphatase family metal-dependent hydrolase
MRIGLLLLFYFPSLVLSQTTIKIDGFFDDWSTNSNTYIDDSTDSQGIDLLGFSVCNDNEYLYVKIRLDDEIDLTEPFYNPSEVMINIDADNNASTGYSTNNIGSEYGINFFDKFIFDDTDPNLIDTLSLYDLDIIPLPTYSSYEFEIAINRSLFSDTIAISIREFIGNDFMPDNGSVFSYIFNNCSSPTTTAIDFSRNDPNNLRLMTYNVWSNGLINNNRVDEHRRIFASANADIITYQECGNTTYNDVLGFLNTSPIYYPYIYPDLNSGNLTISKYPSLQSWQVTNKIDAELIDLPDSIYSTDILIINGHPPCCSNNQGRQENFDAFIEFIHDAKTVGGVIDLPINTPISFSGDMNLVGYSEQYYTIVNGTVSDTATFGSGGFPDWDNTPLKDQVCYFNEKDIAYTWDASNPSAGDYPPGRLDFVFFTNSVMSVDKSFTISTEHMSASLLAQNNLYWDDTKIASDHFPVIVDFVIPMLTGCTDSAACNYDSLATINDSSCVYPAISTITQNGTYLEITISGTYIWNTGEITQTIIPTSNGWYWCIVTDINDCIGDTSFYEVTNIVSAISETTNTDRILLRITDMLGQETPYRRNTTLFYIYDDGTVEKKIKLE